MHKQRFPLLDKPLMMQLSNNKTFLKEVYELVIDSIKSIGMTNYELEQLKLDFPNRSTVSLLMKYESRKLDKWK